MNVNRANQGTRRETTLQLAASATALLLAFGVLTGLDVCGILWHGGTLHSQIIRQGKHGPFTVDVWVEFVRSIVTTLLGASILLLVAWHDRRQIRHKNKP